MKFSNKLPNQFLEALEASKHRKTIQKDKKYLKFKIQEMTKFGPQLRQNHKNNDENDKFSQLTLQS